MYLAEQGYRVIVPELRGHGRSKLSKPAAQTDFSISAMMLDLVSVLDDAGVQSVSFIGNSLGGILGLGLMKEHQARLDRFASFGTTYSLRTLGIAIWLMPRMYKLLGQNLVARIGAKGTSRILSTQQFMRNMFLSSDLDVVARILPHIGKYNLIENAVQFKKPILMLRGEHDSSINSALGPTLEAMRKLPSFELVDVKGAGHCANLDAPAEVRRAMVRFAGDA